MRFSAAVFSTVALAVWSSACHPETPLKRFKIIVSSLDDDGATLSDVRVAVNGKEVGSTGPEGGLAIKILAHPGKVVRIQTKCPKAFRDSRDVKTLKLQVFERNEPVNTLRVTSVCKPRTRTAAVLVRAPGWANLPVLWRGQAVGKTDKNGVAHILMAKMSPKTRFQLTLDTSSKPRLRPKSPSATFALADADRAFTFEQRLEELPAPKKRRRRRKAKPLPPLPEVMPSIYTPAWKLRQIEREKKTRDERRRQKRKKRHG